MKQTSPLYEAQFQNSSLLRDHLGQILRVWAFYSICHQKDGGRPVELQHQLIVLSFMEQIMVIIPPYEE